VRVLIVEDETLQALTYKLQLESEDSEVLGPASSAEEALNIALQEHPDLILMDITLLGETDGIQTASLIQAQETIPIIYLSANTDSATQKRAAQTSPLGFIPKPIDIHKLGDHIRACMS
jgi:DNA-binding response OmpR family regulator